MADKVKTITISVKDDFSRQLREFARQVGNADTAIDGVASSDKDLGKTADKFNEITQAASTLYSIGSQVVTTMVNLANEGIKIGQTAASFEKLAGGSREANEWITAIMDASRGGLTDFEATNTAIQLMTMGLADSAEEAGRFMEVAAITKAINPELGTMENTIANIGLTLANDSWMRLDQLGVDATQLKERMAELEKQGIATTEAFDIGVMEQLEANAKVIGTEVLDIGRDTAEMQTNWRELKEAASEFALVITEEISPALSFVLDQMVTFVEGWTTILSGDMNLSGYDTSDAATRAQYSANLEGLVSPQEAQLNAYMAANGMVQDANGNWVFAQAGASYPGIQRQFGDATRTGTGMEGITALLALTQGRTPQTLLPFEDAGRVPIYDPSTSLNAPFSFDKQAFFNETFGQQEPSGIWGDIFTGIGDSIQTGFGKGKSAAREFFALVDEEVQRQREEFENQTVAERFGAGVTGFEKSVMEGMNIALKESEVSAENAAEAMQIFSFMTGAATGGTELFDRQLKNITDKFETGAIDAKEYAQQIGELSQMDLSTINAVVGGYVQGGMFEEANNYIDNLASMDLEELQSVFDFMKPEEGDAETNQFQTIIDDASEMDETVTSTMEDATAKWIASLDETSTQGKEAFKNLEEDSLGYLENMLDYINSNFSGMTWEFTATASVGNTEIEGAPVTSAGGNELVPAFAEGGYTGSGSSPFLAMLHPNELVIPLNRMPVGNGGGGGDTVSVDLYIDGRQVESAVTNVKRLKNEVM